MHASALLFSVAVDPRATAASVNPHALHPSTPASVDQRPHGHLLLPLPLLGQEVKHACGLVLLLSTQLYSLRRSRIQESPLVFFTRTR
ncbi:hypothetical protein B0H13DRAFT_2043106, partial [Mycena leptocephala]